MLNKRADKLELLRIAEAVALEKSIDKELIINSMETGIAKAAKSKFGQDNEIKVLINRDNGDIEIFRKLIITENPENSNTEIELQDAINLDEINKDKKIRFFLLLITSKKIFHFEKNEVVIIKVNVVHKHLWITSSICPMCDIYLKYRTPKNPQKKEPKPANNNPFSNSLFIRN